MANGRKGFWRMFESIVAVSILMVFVLSLSIQYVREPAEPIMKIRGYEILENMDKNDKLRGYVMAGDSDGINSAIVIGGYNHSIEICDYSGTCNGTYPDAENIWLSVYYVAGENTYDPREVKLYIW
ncbi:MAG: hypothetical protein JW754_00455 [Candidatus Aenigmarchaeota archaeon]|nr:hypothetical protein [Candidatus Aenigmarchaeota archaeon]